jgi:hypothetical protein
MAPRLFRLDLLIAAPSDPGGLPGWGDHHFARALMRAFARRGVACRLLFRDTCRQWAAPAPDRLLLVLRGKFRPEQEWLQAMAYRQKLLWLISWPDDLLAEELPVYDRIYVASRADLPRVAGMGCVPCQHLLQASEFSLEGPPRPARGGLLFVGNCRDRPRPLVAAFHAAGLRLALFGQGWAEHGIPARGGQIANAALPLLYRRSLAVLNDHQPAMRQHGYLSNRVYDVLACGVPVITDGVADCPEELRPALVEHGEGADPLESLEQVVRLRSDRHLLRQVALRVHHEHSFDARVRTLLSDLGAPG